MSEWLKEHAWKLNPAARADAHQIPPTQFPINDLHDIDMRRSVAVSEGVSPGFRGPCDTVLTQTRLRCRGHTPTSVMRSIQETSELEMSPRRELVDQGLGHLLGLSVL
jgi:hypothetical protein